MGVRFATLLLFFLTGAAIFLPKYGISIKTLQWMVIITGIGFYIPSLILWYLRSKRQEEIFLSLPDALDLLVVCVESGLGLDAAMRELKELFSDPAIAAHASFRCSTEGPTD